MPEAEGDSIRRYAVFGIAVSVDSEKVFLCNCITYCIVMSCKVQHIAAELLMVGLGLGLLK